MTQHENSNSKVWLGIVLVIIGSYFLLRNLHMIPSFLPYWLFGWESIFIIIGGAMLITGRREGLVFLGIGAFFILPDILDIPRFRVRDWWPLILIILGLSIFFRRRSYISGEPDFSNEEYFKDTSIFGGSSHIVTSKKLKGVQVSSIFGSSELNMVEAEMGQKEVIVDCLCIFGGNEIVVPEDWTVINEMFVVFGGFSDMRSKSGVVRDPDKVLRLKGMVLFGGSEVKS